MGLEASKGAFCAGEEAHECSLPLHSHWLCGI